MFNVIVVIELFNNGEDVEFMFFVVFKFVGDGVIGYEKGMEVFKKKEDEDIYEWNLNDL